MAAKKTKATKKTTTKRTPAPTKAAGKSAGKTDLGYGAVDDTTKRRHPIRHTSGEVCILPQNKRERAMATARDDRRNFTILAWMVRRHLDCVSRFTPEIRTRDKDVTKAVKTALRWHGTARQFDALGKHGRDEWMRMFEACKVIGGDVGGLKVTGMHLQGIEGDRICKPTEFPRNTTDATVNKAKKLTSQGLLMDKKTGRVKEYCVCKRGKDGKGLIFETFVPAAEMIFDAYWPDRFDSDRGVSPLLSALNEGADIRETWEWLVVKAKASAVFGLKFTRESSDPLVTTQGDDPEAVPENESAAYSQQVTAAMKARGLLNLDLDPGDDVAEIESKTPNNTVIKFTRELIRSVLLALDIPFTFYDSLSASFSARIADRNEYEEACEWKRTKNVNVLDKIYGEWLLPAWAEANLFGLKDALEAAEMDIAEVAASLRWVPAGRPWLDRAGEMSGHILSLAAGTTSTPRIAASYGDDAYEIAEEQAAYLSTVQIPLLYAQGGQVPVNDLLKQVNNGQIPGSDRPPKDEGDPDDPDAPAAEPDDDDEPAAQDGGLDSWLT